jgi:hypothetical protein
MPNNETDSSGFNTKNADQERDLAAKGGPTTGTGIPDDKHGIAAPYDSDLQTQIAAKSKKKSNNVTTPKTEKE